MKNLLTAGTALGLLLILSVPQHAEARTYFSLQLGGPTYVAPPSYYQPYPYYVAPVPTPPTHTIVVPQYYYPPAPCYRVPHYTPWGVVYGQGYY